MASATEKPKPTLDDLIEIEIVPSRGQPPQPMVKLKVKNNMAGVYMGYSITDDLIAKLIQARDIAERLFRERYPQREVHQ